MLSKIVLPGLDVSLVDLERMLRATGTGVNRRESSCGFRSLDVARDFGTRLKRRVSASICGLVAALARPVEAYAFEPATNGGSAGHWACESSGA
jgi:hypothetical protein